MKIKSVKPFILHVPVTGSQIADSTHSISHWGVVGAQIDTEDGLTGYGFTGTHAHLASDHLITRCIETCHAPLLVGEDSRDITRLWQKLARNPALQWVGRAGITSLAHAAIDVALWDLKAKRAGKSLGKLLGAFRNDVPCYNTSGGYLNASLDEVIKNVERSLGRGLGGIKLKVGQPDLKKDIERVRTVRQHVGEGIPMMVDANQQWDYTTALRAGRQLDDFGLVWLEEPLSAYDYEGHAKLSERLVTPIATGEMLSSVAECAELVKQRSVTFMQADVPRVGGITPFLKISTLSDLARLKLAPHFVMEIHIHLGCAYPHEAWVEHIEWLEPAINERLVIKDGRMLLPDRPGLGFSLSEQAQGWREGIQRI